MRDESIARVPTQRLLRQARRRTKMVGAFPKGHKPASMVIGVSALSYKGLPAEIKLRAVTN